MRKVIAFAHLSLDGLMQGPGGADEDRSGLVVNGLVTRGAIAHLHRVPMSIPSRIVEDNDRYGFTVHNGTS